MGIRPTLESLRPFPINLKVQDGLTDHHIIFYLIRLRVLSRIMLDNFLNPNVENLKSVIMLRSSKPDISHRPVEDYKHTIRKYYGSYQIMNFRNGPVDKCKKQFD